MIRYQVVSLEYVFCEHRYLLEIYDDSGKLLGWCGPYTKDSRKALQKKFDYQGVMHKPSKTIRRYDSAESVMGRKRLPRVNSGDRPTPE